MAKPIPVDYDPFSDEPDAGAPVPVDYDPFSDTSGASSEKPSLLSRAISAVKSAITPAERTPLTLEQELEAKTSKTQLSPWDAMRTSSGMLPAEPRRTSAPVPAERPALSPIKPPTFEPAAAAPDRTSVSGTRPAPAATEADLKAENAKRSEESREALLSDVDRAVRAGFTKQKYGSLEAAVKEYRKAIGRPVQGQVASTAELDAIRGRGGQDLASFADLEAEVAAKAAADPKNEARRLVADYRKERADRDKAYEEAKKKYGSKVLPGLYDEPTEMELLSKHLQSIGQPPLKPRLRSPEQYAEELTGRSRAEGAILGETGVALGDAMTRGLEMAGWDLVANAMTNGKAFDDERRMQLAKSSLESRKTIAELKKKQASGEPLTVAEGRALEENKFYNQVIALGTALKENPTQVGEDLLTQFIADAPLYMLGGMASSKALETIVSGVKSAQNANRIRQAAKAGEQALAAERKAQTVAAMRATPGLVKQSALKNIGINVATDIPGDVAVGAILNSSRGQDYKASDFIVDVVGGAIISLPVGVLAAVRGGGVLTPKQFDSVAKAFDIAGLKDEPRVAKMLQRLQKAAANKVFMDESVGLAVTGADKIVSEEEALRAGYNLDALGDGPYRVMGSTVGRNIEINRGADEGTIEEELATVSYNILRDRAMAAPEGPEAELMGRIEAWADAIRAENAARPDGERMDLPEGTDAESQRNADIELFTKAYASDVLREAVDDGFDMIVIPSDIYDDFGRMFETATARPAVREGALTGRGFTREEQAAAAAEAEARIRARDEGIAADEARRAAESSAATEAPRQPEPPSMDPQAARQAQARMVAESMRPVGLLSAPRRVLADFLPEGATGETGRNMRRPLDMEVPGPEVNEALVGAAARKAGRDARRRMAETREPRARGDEAAEQQRLFQLRGGGNRQPQFKEDIPSEDWLKENADEAAKAPRNQFGVPRMNKVTGRFDEPVMMPVEVLVGLKGERGEQSNVRQNDLENIRKVIRETGKLPLDESGREYAPYIEIGYDGVPWVSDGNHRIMAAAAEGLKEIPVEIKYFDGGQRKAGDWAPDKVVGVKGARAPARGDETTQQQALFQLRGSRADEAGADAADVEAARKAWREKGTDSPYFRKWFGDSKVVDDDGKPLVVYHGTGADFEAFDPQMTGKGNDQFGSGFYFTNRKEVADVYQLRDDPNTGEKLGGKSSPNTIESYVSIKKPIEAPLGYQNLRFFKVKPKDAAKVIEMADNIFDANESPLTNFIDNGGKSFTKSDVMKVASENSWDLMSLENDFFRDNSTGFRKAVNAATGYDGVIKSHGGGVKEIVAWFPEQIKSTGNRGTFDPADPRINYQLRGFKSKARETIEKKMPNRASVKDVRGLLGGASQDEMKWMGIDDYLADKIQVNKADLLRYMDENAVDVQEVVKGESETRAPFELEWDGGEGDNLITADLPSGNSITIYHDYDEGGGSFELQVMTPDAVELGRPKTFDTLEEAKAAADEMVRDERQDVVDGTKYDQYQLPGGKNYRELLLTMPRRTTQPAWNVIGPDGEAIDGLTFTSQRSAESQARVMGQGHTVRRGGTVEHKYGDANFRSSHFDEPNILAHVRFNDRTLPDGRKVLFLEEVQSDWHQQGRKKGYQGEVRSLSDIEAEESKVQRERSALIDAAAALPDSKMDEFNRINSQIKEMGDRLSELRIEQDRAIKAGAAVPDAPFKKTWHELALRRMMQYAAENGYDGVAWLPGAEQAKRYDLSKKVDKIVVPVVDEGGGRSVRIHQAGSRETIKLMVDANGNVEPAFNTAGNNQFAGKKIDEVIGKDVAEKVMSAEAGAELSGLDLQVGGEGMVGFYDRIAPQYLNKLGKKWGARVGEVDIDAGKRGTGGRLTEDQKSELRDLADEANYHSFDEFNERLDDVAGVKIDEEGYDNLGDDIRDPSRRASAKSEFVNYIADMVKNGQKSLQGVPFIPVTDAMRTSIRTEGLPLFQLRGSRSKGVASEQERMLAVDVMRAVLASEKPMSAKTAAEKMGLKGAQAEDAARRAASMVREVRGGKQYDEVLAKDALKSVTKRPSEKLKSTILRTTGKGITGTEIVSAKEVLHSIIRQLQLKADLQAYKDAAKEARRIRRLIVAVTKKALDKDLQWQMLGVVRDAKTDADLLSAMQKISLILSRERLKKTAAGVEEMMAVDASKMEARFRDAFTAITGDLSLGRGNAAARKYLKWYEDQPEKPPIPKRFVKAMEEIRGDRIPTKSDINSMTPEQIVEAEAKWSAIADALGTIKAAADEAENLRFNKDALKLKLTVDRGADQIAKENPVEFEDGKGPGIIKKMIRNGASPEYLVMLTGGRDGILHNVLYKRPAASMSDAYMDLYGLQSMMREFLTQSGKSDQDIIRWRGESFTVKLDNGKTLTLTRPEAVSFYATMANDESAGLIRNNGIQRYSKKGTGHDTGPLTDADIDRIKSNMTDFDIKTAETMLAIFDSYKAQMNEASTILHGYEKFTVENYFPRFASQDYIDNNLTELKQFFEAKMLEQADFTKDRFNHGDPLVIADAFTVFDRHIHDATMYANMAVPLRNALRVIGNSKIKQQIGRRLGGNLNKSIEEFLFDASGMRNRAAVDDASRLYKAALRTVSVGILGYRPTTIVNNLFGAAAQTYAEIPDRYRAQFMRNWAAMSPAEEAKVFQEMMAMDPYFHHRYARDPGRIATYGALELNETIASSNAYLNFKKFQDHSMEWMQDAERRTAVAAYKAIRDMTGYSEAKAELSKRFKDASDSKNPISEYAAHEAMILTRRTQNAIDALDKSAFARKMVEHPWAMSMFMFTSQISKLRDMAMMAALDYKRGHINKTEFARKLSMVMLSAAVIPTFASMAWREAKEGFKDRKDSEEQKRMGAGMMMLMNSVDLIDPRVGPAIRSMIAATHGSQGSGQRGAPITQAMERLIKNTKKAIDKSDEESLDAFIAALGAGAPVLGVPSAPFEAIGAVVKFTRPDDPLIPYYNERFKIEEKFGVDKKTNKKRTLSQAQQAGVTLSAEDIATYKQAQSVIEHGLKMRRLAEEGKITDEQAEKVIEQRTKKPSP